MKRLSRPSRIFLSVWLVYLVFVYAKPESISGQMVDLAVSMVDHGDVVLRHTIDYKDVSFSGGHYLCGHFPGAAVPVALMYAVSRPMFVGLEGAARFYPVHFLALLVVSTVIGAGTVVVFDALLGDLGWAGRRRLPWSFVFAFGTMNLNYATSIYKVNQVVLCVLTSFWLFHRAGKQDEWSAVRLFGGGLLLGTAVATHPPYALISAALYLYALLSCGWKRSLLVVMGASVPAFLLGVYLNTAFGSFVASPYSFRLFVPSFVISYPRWQNLLYLLLSPREGLFIFVPVLVLGLWGMRELLENARTRREAVACLLAAFSTVVFFAGYIVGDGKTSVVSAHDASIAIRFLAPVCPFLMVLGAPVAARMKGSVLLAFGAPSVFFSYLGARAGFLPGGSGEQLAYSIKSFFAGTGMTSLFANTLPRWLGVETLSTYVTQPGRQIHTLLFNLDMGRVLSLLTFQALAFVLFLGVVFLVLLAWRRIWREGLPRQ